MFSMEGVFDLHVHSAPDIFDRSGDDIEFALEGERRGMAGIALKSALEPTAGRAYLANKAAGVQKFKLVGGVVLNYTVGGINPTAVDTLFKMGGRVVWAPSGHAMFHANLKGSLGNWGRKGMVLHNPRDAKGITVFNEKGKLSDDTKEVLALVREHNGVFCTSHLGPDESIALAKYCGKEKTKIVFTHLGWTPGYDFEVGKAFAAAGGTVELCAVTFGSFDNTLPMDFALKAIREYGADRVVLATDAGNHRFVSPFEALRSFAENLILAGIPEKDVRKMMGSNPLKLIGK